MELPGDHRSRIKTDFNGDISAQMVPVRVRHELDSSDSSESSDDGDVGSEDELGGWTRFVEKTFSTLELRAMRQKPYSFY